MGVCMDGWMDGWIDRQVNGWEDSQQACGWVCLLVHVQHNNYTVLVVSVQFIPSSILFNCVDVLLDGAHLCCLLNAHALLVNVGRYLCQEDVVSDSEHCCVSLLVCVYLFIYFIFLQEKMDKCFCVVEELSRKYVLPDKVKGLMQDLCERRKVRQMCQLDFTLMWRIAGRKISKGTGRQTDGVEERKERD